MPDLNAPMNEEELQYMRNRYGPEYIEGKGFALIVKRRIMLALIAR